jgi:hypothetical protein
MLIGAPIRTDGVNEATGSGSVEFVIKQLPNENGANVWQAFYISQGKSAHFKIELGPAKEEKKDPKDPPNLSIATGAGRLVSEPGSDASVFLTDLKKALLAKSLPAKIQRAPSIPFEFVKFGDHLSPASGGGMSVDPPGNWVSMKLFFGEGDDESQVFLNLNPVDGVGQFSLKDEEYGDLLLAQFAKVL